MASAREQGIQEGTAVFASDGQRLGTVAEVQTSQPGVGPESGLVMVQSDEDPNRRLAVPFSMVRSVRQDRVVLDVTAAEVARQDWGAERRR